MNRLSHHPAPKGNPLSTARAGFLLITGPLAWFVQVCIGDSLLSWPCFPLDTRLEAPVPGYEGTRVIALVLLLLCATLAAASGMAAWRTLRAVMDETEDDHVHIGRGRTRFIAMWGMILGFGFTIATLVTLAGLALVPRCVG